MLLVHKVIIRDSSKMNYFVLLVVLIYSASVQAAPFRVLTQEEELKDRKQREQIGLECLKETNLNRAVVDKAKQSTTEFMEDQTYKDFLACSYKRQGFQNTDGSVLYDNLVDFLGRFYSKSDLKALDVCKSVSGSNHGEIAFNLMKCVITKLYEIEKN